MAKTRLLSVHIDDETLSALDDLSESLGKGGVKVARASVVRAALVAGMVEIRKTYAAERRKGAA